MAGNRYQVGAIVRQRHDRRLGVVVDHDRDHGASVWWLPSGPRSRPEADTLSVILDAREVEQLAALHAEEQESG